MWHVGCRSGSERKKATCFDLNGACTGSLLALNTAQAYLAQGIYRNALVIGAEKLSGLTDWTDRGTCILFGDECGSSRAESRRGWKLCTGNPFHWKKRRHLPYRAEIRSVMKMIRRQKETYIQMNGKEVFSFAVSSKGTGGCEGASFPERVFL